MGQTPAFDRVCGRVLLLSNFTLVGLRASCWDRKRQVHMIQKAPRTGEIIQGRFVDGKVDSPAESGHRSLSSAQLVRRVSGDPVLSQSSAGLTTGIGMYSDDGMLRTTFKRHSLGTPCVCDEQAVRCVQQSFAARLEDYDSTLIEAPPVHARVCTPTSCCY